MDGIFDKKFSSPPNVFRGAPFWAWNGELDKEELIRQIDCFQRMGFGGFFMHSRAGLATEYLGNAFMDCVKMCVEYAKQKDMKAYLYDEDRWPSGAAGGFVTKEKKYRQKRLILSQTEINALPYDRLDCEPKLIGYYDIKFAENGRLLGYSFNSTNDCGTRWYAYEIIAPKSGWYNGYTHVDAMQAEATDKFIQTTHMAYKRKIGGEFGKTVPAIFTDEPDYGKFNFKAFSLDGKDIEYPWTSNFSQLFEDKYGENIIEKLPELIWQTNEIGFSLVRYRYFNLLTELFATAYCDKIGNWCDENGIGLVGHVLNEPRLLSQTTSVGEAMRMYKTFTLPGIDMLCNAREFTTAKQAQSVAHQYGRIGTLSEMYGVTGWDFDFRGHKFQGDWQAALGVVFRVPHLSWLYMKGSAKRDFPASIGCQSSWFQEYSYIENYFARLNTALTEGHPVVRLAVLHPIESVWCTAGVVECSETANTLDENFIKLTEWLLRGQIDFDFISESLLTEQTLDIDEKFGVGCMHYQAVLIPPIISIRATTLAALEAFVDKGGKVLSCGDAPILVDGAESNLGVELWKKITLIHFVQNDILNSLKFLRDIMVYDGFGNRKNDFLYQLREDENGGWLFLSHCDPKSRHNGSDCVCEELTVEIKGKYSVMLYDSLNGKTERIAQKIDGEKTLVFVKSYPLDSFLLRLNCNAECVTSVNIPEQKKTYTSVRLSEKVAYELSEPNVLVLDQCEWSLDGIHYNEREEILRIDKKIREQYHWPNADGNDVQPWCIKDSKQGIYVWLKFNFNSNISVNCEFACEELLELICNGHNIALEDTGFFVDKSIRRYHIQDIRKGKNEILIKVPISARTSLENCFILGNFGVKICGAHADIVRLPKKIPFGSITEYGFPFYGGAITYKLPFETTGERLMITADNYSGALISAKIDDCEVGKIVIPPYKLFVEGVERGRHELRLTLFASRINVFGALHLDVDVYWKDASMWYSENNKWAYEYRLKSVGILKRPVLETEQTNR